VTVLPITSSPPPPPTGQSGYRHEACTYVPSHTYEIAGETDYSYTDLSECFEICSNDDACLGFLDRSPVNNEKRCAWKDRLDTKAVHPNCQSDFWGKGGTMLPPPLFLLLLPPPLSLPLTPSPPTPAPPTPSPPTSLPPTPAPPTEPPTEPPTAPPTEQSGYHREVCTWVPGHTYEIAEETEYSYTDLSECFELCSNDDACLGFLDRYPGGNQGQTSMRRCAWKSALGNKAADPNCDNDFWGKGSSFH
jgi:hypothetical protein